MEHSDGLASQVGDQINGLRMVDERNQVVTVVSNPDFSPLKKKKKRALLPTPAAGAEPLEEPLDPPLHGQVIWF